MARERSRKLNLSVIAPGMCVMGDIRSLGALRVGGEVLGDIECVRLLIDTTASVQGHIVARAVKAAGRVNGSITAEELVLASGSQVRGRINYRTLRVEEGSSYETTEPLVNDGLLDINGLIIGNLDCAELHLGPRGRIEGDIVARSVIIEGQVIGNIHANSVAFSATAEVVGDVYHCGLTVQRGAYFEGKQRRVADPSAAAHSLRAPMRQATLGAW